MKRTERANPRARRLVILVLVVVAGVAGLLVVNRLTGTAGATAEVPRVVVLGFDGMDFGITSHLIETGDLPNFARLKEAGGMMPLQTSLPPQSPVAWANFITGQNPGGHGIYDFVARDPKTYLPYLSTTMNSQPGRNIRVGKYLFPLSGGKVDLMREGRAFWEDLSAHDVPCAVLRVPSNFPPVDCEARSLSGMGTPDILGTYGTFSYFTTEPGQVRAEQGGRCFEVDRVNDVVETSLPGPANPLVKDNPPSSAKFTIYMDPKEEVAKVVMDDQEFILKAGEWSDWVRVGYRLAPWSTLHGICRFLLVQVHPDLKLYVTPVNIDPEHPAMPISVPADFAGELARSIGLFYTQGIAEDTWGLDEGRLTDAQYLQQAQFVWDERWRMLEYEMRRYEGGFLFFYMSTTDVNQHMFWRAQDPESPDYTPELAAAHGAAIVDIYKQADKALGYVMDQVGPNTTVMALSDHGFGPFRRNVQLNTWLRREGYLRFTDESKAETGEFFQGVDWSRTRAYAVGLNGLFLNLRDREGQGIVNPGAEAEALATEIATRLEGLVDPATGERVVSRCYITSREYSGSAIARGPDLIPGYTLGYRGSWETALGKCTADLFTDNNKKWSGDHCIDPRAVPGILVCNRPLRANDAYLYDMAPTILTLYGIKPDSQMVGKPVL